MKVIALDFDGVLNDDAHRKATVGRFPGVVVFNEDVGKAMLDPVRCARVQRLCNETGASILFVTGWRQYASAEELSKILRGCGLTVPVLGSVRGMRFSGDMRGTALLDWIDEHPEVTGLVVLDDTESYYRNHPRLLKILVAPKDGIEEGHVERALAILAEIPE